MYIIYKDHIWTLLSIQLLFINYYNNQIQFTHQLKDNQINFLDITVKDKMTKWYQKTILLGRFNNYFSNHPIQQKISMVKIMPKF